MVVTNNRLNPSGDAIKVLDAIRHNPNWDDVYTRVASGYSGKYKRVLDMAISEEATKRGLNGQRVLTGLAKVFEESEADRAKMGSEIKVGITGNDLNKSEVIEGSAIAQNTMQGYDDFLKYNAGDVGVALASSGGLASITQDDINKIQEIKAQSGEEGLESSTSWLAEF